MVKPNKKKPDIPQRRTLQRLPEDEDLTTILGQKRELPSPVIPVQSSPNNPMLQESNIEQRNPACSAKPGKTNIQTYVDTVMRHLPAALTVANLKTSKFVYGELRSDQQAYLVDESTAHLKVFSLSGDVADAVLCSTDLKASRSGDTKLDRYVLRIDLGAENEMAIDAMNHCVEMLHSSDVMLQLAREARIDQKDIQVVQQGASSVYYQIFNSAGSFYKPLNILSRFWFRKTKHRSACLRRSMLLQCRFYWMKVKTR